MGGPAVCDGSGDVDWCTVKRRHEHCVCGLPMKADARMCRLCEKEGLLPSKEYPSFRQNRTRSPDPMAYVALLMAAHSYERMYPTR